LLNNPADSGDKPVQFVNHLYEDIYTVESRSIVFEGDGENKR